MKEKYSVLYKIIQFFYTNFPKQYGQVQYLKARLFLVPKILLLKINFLNFFGSKGQDKWVVEEIFNYKKNGFFLDLAATDGLLESNTYVLEYYFGFFHCRSSFYLDICCVALRRRMCFMCRSPLD